MVHQLGELGIVIDYGGNKPGSVLQHQVFNGRNDSWQNYLVEGKPLSPPVDINSLPPGEYRLFLESAVND
jgi:hypothetical protein